MSDTLPITNNIAARFIERKWMRSAKAWRCFIDIPSDNHLPEALTALIERHVKVEMVGAGIRVEIEPAFVVDVPSRKKQFQIVIETAYEFQATLGPRLTALTGSDITLSILPTGKAATTTKTETPRNPETLDERKIRGLHVSFFQNPKFWEWLSENADGQIIGNPTDCKSTFKALLQVQSCKDIRNDQFSGIVANFNSWLNGGGIAQT